MSYTEMYLFYNRATTIARDGTWTTTTAFPLPDWAPDIAYMGTTHEMMCVRASTSGAIRGGLGADPALVRIRQASRRAYVIESRNDKKSYWTAIVRYRSVGELVR